MNKVICFYCQDQCFFIACGANSRL